MTTTLEAFILLAPVWCALSALTALSLWAARKLRVRSVRRDRTSIANAHRFRERELQAAISVSEGRH